MIIETRYGKIEGVDQKFCCEYRRVPYAKPPVGELRWRAPQPVEPWDGIYHALEYADKCMQETNNSEPYEKDFNSDPAYARKMSEDCLYLNIWVPKHAPEKCPVALWIHGGAFMGGYATELEFDGTPYAKRGIIVASVEYRCNIFGYFAHPWLSAENEQHISGNYGTFDQIAALNWIHENIAAFGGDPENITLFGQSAGAMSVQTLVSSRLASGKVKQAILQSGGSYGTGLHRDITLPEQERYGQIYTELMGIKSPKELRALPADKIEQSIGAWFEQVMPITKGLFLTPTIDGHVLEDGYYAIMDNGRIADIPYIIGANKDDIDVMGREGNIHPDTMLLKGSINFSHKLESLGRKPAYVYYFTRELPGDRWGAYHSAELFYMFGTLERCWRPWEPRDYDLSERMIDYWSNFMRCGNPNGEGLPVWKPCSKENAALMTFS